MIAEMTDGAPLVQAHGSRIAMFADAGNEQHGFVFGTETATVLALRLLGGVDEVVGTRRPMVAIDSVAIDVQPMDDGELAVRMVVTIEGGRFALHLDPTRLAKLVAGLAEASRIIDRPAGRPRSGI